MEGEGFDDIDLDIDKIYFEDVWSDKPQCKMQRRDVTYKLFKMDAEVSSALVKGPLLGFGRFGSVYEMLDTDTNTKVAAKVFQRSVEPDGEKTKSLRISEKVMEREASVLRLLDNENIVKLLKIVESPQSFYMCLELCDKSLFDVLEVEATLQEDEAQVVIKAVSAGLQYLHSNEFAHRDLKLTNILCMSNGGDRSKPLLHSVKIADFGLAACRGPPGTANLLTCVCGTPPFMAPEILMKDPYDVKVDIWSLGVILFCCLFGQEPFPGIDEDEVKESIFECHATLDCGFFETFSDGVVSLLKRMLQVDPLTRLSASQVQNDSWTHGSLEEQPCQKKRRRRKAPNDILGRMKEILEKPFY